MPDESKRPLVQQGETLAHPRKPLPGVLSNSSAERPREAMSTTTNTENTNDTSRQSFHDCVQLELFSTAPINEHTKYWKKCLKEWPSDILANRHFRNTTGWSMAVGYFSFALLLFRAGELTKDQFKRYCRLNRRVRRWDRSDFSSPNSRIDRSGG